MTSQRLMILTGYFILQKPTTKPKICIKSLPKNVILIGIR